MVRSYKFRDNLFLLICVWTLIGLGLLAVTMPSYGCGSAPIAVDDFLSVDEEATLLDALANDSDLEGQALTLSILSTDCPGTVTVDQGLIVVDPGSPLTAACTISYEVRNENGEFAIGTISVSPFSPIFTDDFESGTPDAWSFCDPAC